MLHDRLKAVGACFGEVSGWERPNWFGKAGTVPVYKYSYSRQNWFENSRAEHQGVRQGVGLFDLSSFGKMLLQGRMRHVFWVTYQAVMLIFSPVTRFIHSGLMLGGIEADLTVTGSMTISFDRNECSVAS
ncbi:MAG: hypothetical protein CM1200mP41_25190 [Gammaproteobacteria bacterium]|nr:MAG: hypothetical protein CM1200mP41_25190 [Gammaproteobacteria bacterium]